MQFKRSLTRLLPDYIVIDLIDLINRNGPTKRKSIENSLHSNHMNLTEEGLPLRPVRQRVHAAGQPQQARAGGARRPDHRLRLLPGHLQLPLDHGGPQEGGAQRRTEGVWLRPLRRPVRRQGLPHQAHGELVAEAVRSLELGNVWEFVQLIFGPHWFINQLYKNKDNA